MATGQVIGPAVRHLIDRIRQEASVETRPRAEALGAWLLRPTAATASLLAALVAQAVRHDSAVRHTVYPDRPWANPSSADYLASAAVLREELLLLLGRLGWYSLPFYSYRYQGHLLWDTTLPSIAG